MVLAAVALGVNKLLVLLLERRILVGAAVELAIHMLLVFVQVLLGVQVLLLSAHQELLHRLQDRQLLQPVAEILSIHLQVAAQLRSEVNYGALCKSRRRHRHSGHRG